jgi:choline dehydrogenase-like flavoprotein
MLDSGSALPPGWLVRAFGKNVFTRRPQVGEVARHAASADPDARWFGALVPGGMSNHWAGAVPRFAPEDFTEGERLHERYRWPVSYADLAPYYERVERLLGVVGTASSVPNLPRSVLARERRLPTGWRRIATRAAQAGHGLTLLPQASGPSWTLRRTGVGFNSFTGIVRPLGRFPHFRLRLGSHALRLEWDGDQRRVRSVIYYDRISGCERRVAGAAVVVAGGPLASTKLLLDSTSSDFPRGLGDTEGLLGRYLHDHPFDMGTVELDAGLPRLGHPAYLTRGAYGSSSPLLGAAFTFGSELTSDKVLAFTPLKTRTFNLWAFGTMVPRQENRVQPHPDLKDEFGLPQLDIHISFGEEEERTLIRAREQLAGILDAAGFRSTVRSSVQKRIPGMSMHFGGTVRMHDSPAHGMLNAWNRLHAVDNVVVADASSFTTGPEKNPTLTVMALAARATHRLAVDLKSA